MKASGDVPLCVIANNEENQTCNYSASLCSPLWRRSCRTRVHRISLYPCPRLMRIDETTILSLSLFHLASAIKLSSSSNSRRSSETFDLKLRNPPVRHRAINGTINSDSPSPTLSPTDCFPSLSIKPSSSKSDKPSSSSSEPPPIPPRTSLLNTTNKRVEGQFVRPGEVPVKAKRNILRSRNVKRREPTAATVTSAAPLKNTRSDSADALSLSSSDRHDDRSAHRRLQVPIDHGAISD